MPSIDLQTGCAFALPLDPHRPWALPRGPAPAAFRPGPPDQPCADWMRALPGAIMTGKKRSEKRQRSVTMLARFTPEESKVVRDKAEACVHDLKAADCATVVNNAFQSDNCDTICS